jgi:hypothetical protein
VEPAAPQEAAVEAPLPLGEQIARLLETQADLVAQRQVYNSQQMLGVSATGTDVVNAREAVLTVAQALRSGDSQGVRHALANLGAPQISQINDHTLPFRYNAQVAGLFEGILLDTLSKGLAGDDARQGARAMVEQIFIDANELAERQHKAQLAYLSPGPHTNARK